MTHAVVELRPLARLRGRLTRWYLLTFGGILLLLGGTLFVVIRHQLSAQLDESLARAARELIHAARIREMEAVHVQGPVVDAIDELHVPDRLLFLMDSAGRPIKPDSAPAWLGEIARNTSGAIDESHEIGERTWRVHAERFRIGPGRPSLVAIAIADDIELESRYAALIAAFGGMALAALLLVAVGGSFLVRESTRPVEHAVARMRRFMADAAHELRTPLTVIRSRAEVALQQPRGVEEYAEALRGVQRETERLSGIVDNLLLLARADSGELPLKVERLYLDDIALDAATAARALAQNKGVDLSLPRFDEAPVEGDRGLLRQLAMILLDNAVKFTPAGGTVTVRVVNEDDRPAITVRDTGVGIASRHLPHVFERFYRGDPSRARGEGAGLGLAIARWIAQQHGAHIDISSSEGEGTEVTVTFAHVNGRAGVLATT